MWLHPAPVKVEHAELIIIKNKQVRNFNPGLAVLLNPLPAAQERNNPAKDSDQRQTKDHKAHRHA
jgi:hypothetical protein